MDGGDGCETPGGELAVRVCRLGKECSFHSQCCGQPYRVLSHGLYDKIHVFKRSPWKMPGRGARQVMGGILGRLVPPWSWTEVRGWARCQWGWGGLD